jgi:uncharacterized protein (TIGR00730 family)
VGGNEVRRNRNRGQKVMDSSVQPKKTICIFAGARARKELLRDSELATWHLHHDGWQFMYGGSSRGVMGAVAEQVKTCQGKITGVLPEKIARLKHFDPDIETIVAKDMSERKAHFWKCDAFLMLPGGIGTLDELFELLCLTKLGYLEPKPCVILNTHGVYDSLESLFYDLTEWGTIPRDKALLVEFVRSPDEIVPVINNWNGKIEALSHE